jgi:hypothetical protein
MSRLTVTEKQHWKNRITKKLDRAMDRLWSKQTGLKASFTAQAEQMVENRFTDLSFAEVRESEKSIKEAEARLKVLEKECIELKRCVLHGLSEQQEFCSDYLVGNQYVIALRKKVEAEMAEVMAAHPIGCKILELEREKEELLDTIWLATSNVQLKSLWTRFAELINEAPTSMQSEAIALLPVEDEPKP